MIDTLPAAVLPPATLFQATVTAPTLRVCHVMSADLWAGAEVQLTTLASYLRDRSDLSVSAVLMNEGRLASELRALGVRVAVVDEHEHSSIAILRFLTQFLRRHRIDIVHTHRYKDTVLGVIAARLAGTPHVVRTVHGLVEPMRGWELAKFRVYETLERAALRWAAKRVIAVSKDVAEALDRRGFRRSSVVRIHNGIDAATVRAVRPREDVRRELGIGSEHLLIGTVGRLATVKAHGCFLRAARLISNLNSSARFAIVGDGPLRAGLEATATSLGVGSSCLFLGPRSDVHDIIGAMDLFVLSSLHEGVPMALLEAMALGRPVVVTGVGGIPEMVTHDVNGVLVPPRDPRALAAACLELSSDPARAARLGERASQTVEEKFSKDANGEAVCREYRAVAAGGRATERAPSTSTADLSAAGLAWTLASAPVRYAVRKIRAAKALAAERRRQEALRRHPARLKATIRRARQILVICHGNIIRSPFAAAMVARSLGGSQAIRIVSGGLAACAGNAAHPTALRIAAERSVDLSNHSSSELTPALISASDAIFVMEVAHLQTMRERFPEAAPRTFLLTSLAADTPLEIADPYDGDDSRFNGCFDHITRAVNPIVEALIGNVRP